MNQEPVCIDDFGVALYRCRFTNELVGGSGAQFIGAFIPGVNKKYVMGNSDLAKEAAKTSRANYDEMESNCNTCANLERIKADSRPDGFLFGRCKTGDVRGVMKFHPNDPMNMDCWTAREKKG